jgi:hypothetical protein
VELAGEHFVVYVFAVAQPFPERVESRHLAAPQPLLLDRGTASKGAVEGDVRLHRTGQIEDPGDAGEGATLLTKGKSVLVAMVVGRDGG